MLPESIKNTRNASTTFNLLGVLSTYELYSVDNGDCVDVDVGVDAELRDLAAADVDVLEPLGGMMWRFSMWDW